MKAVSIEYLILNERAEIVRILTDENKTHYFLLESQKLLANNVPIAKAVSDMGDPLPEISVDTPFGPMEPGPWVKDKKIAQIVEDAVAVERKSFQDLYGTLTAGRDRFERELERLGEMWFSAVVVKASWDEIAKPPMFATKVSPASIVGTIHAWQQRYPIRWITADNRRLPERATYDVLRRYWIDRVEKPIRRTVFDKSDSIMT